MEMAISEVVERMAHDAGFASVEEWADAEGRRLAQKANERRRADEERRRAEEEARRPEKLLEAGGYTRAASPADFDTLCRAVLEARRRGCGLLFVGGVGCGKTTAARALLAGAQFVEATTLRGLFPKWEAQGEAVGGGNWILDDLGAESAFNEYGNRREYAADFICRACDGRARGEGFGRAIITTNLHDADLKRRYGERMASRVRANFIAVVFHAGDLRPRQPVFG